MQRIDTLVRAAIGFDEKRGDQVQVLNVRFDHPPEAPISALPFSLDQSDMIRIAELVVMVIVTALLILFVVRPMLRPGQSVAVGAGGRALQLAPGGGGVYEGGTAQFAVEGGGMPALPQGEFDQKIDIAKIEGQVRASSVKKVSEFIEHHPEESVSILRSWLHEA